MHNLLRRSIKTGLLIFLVSALFSLPGCTEKATGDKEVFRESVNPEIIQVIPRKPTRIELRRKSKGKYTWVLKGEDIDEVIKTDERLKNYTEGINVDK